MKVVTQMDSKTKENLFLHEETRRYFRKKFGNWRKASATKVRRHFKALDSSDLLSIARLNHYAGVVFLEQENPVEAESFLQESVDQYQKCSKESLKGLSDDNRKDLLQAKIFLAQSWIRNYHHLEEADKMLTEIQKLSENNLFSEKDNINVVLAHIALLESALIVELSGRRFTKAEDLYIFPNGCNALAPRSDLEGVVCFEKAVLIFDYALRFRKHELIGEMGNAINNLFRRKPDLKFGLIKALMRRANLDVYLNTYRFCESIVDDLLAEESKDGGCIYASILFTKGLLMFSKMQTISAVECFKLCYNVRKKLLGEKHPETLRSMFMQGYLMVSSSLGVAPVQQDLVKLMTNALDLFRKHASGKFWFLTDLLQYYSKCLTDEGKFKESEEIFKEAIELEIGFKGGDKNPVVAARRFELAKLYLHFQKWQSVIDYNLPAVHGVAFNPCEVTSVGDALGTTAYAYYKLGRNCLADEYFARAVRKINEDDNFSHHEWAITKARIVGFKMEFEFFGMKRPHIAAKDFNDVLKLMNTAKSMRTSRFEPRAFFQMGIYYEFVKNDLSKAIECYLSSSAAASVRYFKAHPYNCDSSLAIARIYFKQCKMKEGEELLTAAFKQACTLFDKNHPYFEPFFDLFQRNVSQQKTINHARNVFTTSMKMFSEQKFPENSCFIAAFGYNFAKRVFEDDFAVVGLKGCQGLLKKSLIVFKKVLGPKDKQSGQCERVLGFCCLKSGRLKMAEWHLFNAAIALLQRE